MTQSSDTHAHPGQPEVDAAPARAAEATKIVASGASADTIQTGRWRPWHALALLVAAHALFNLYLNPMGWQNPADDFPTLLWFGVVFVQPVLFAIWAAWGPPPASKRIPATIALFVLVVFTSCIQPFSTVPGATVVVQGGFVLLALPLLLFTGAMIPMLVVRAATRWRIERPRDDGPPISRPDQFSVSYLLALTTVCAVLLGIGRGLAATQDWMGSPTWQQIDELVTRIGMVLLAIFPAVLVPMIVISPRPTVPLLVGTIVSWAVLAWLGVEAIVHMDRTPRSDAAYQLALVHLGGGMASFASAFVLRRAGYRLVRDLKAYNTDD
jgi:hypothetical protein